MIKQKKSILKIIIFLCLFQHNLFAQDSTRQISLPEVISNVLKNNSVIHLAQMDENIAASNYKQTAAIFLPQVGLSYTAFATDNPLNAFGFKLQEKNITQNDFYPALLNNPKSATDFTTKLEVQQPIINMDLLYKRKAAEKQKAFYQNKTERTKEYLAYESQKAYLQLQLAYTMEKVLKDALETAKSVYTFTENHYKQGLIQKSDLLNAKVQITTVETNIAKAASNIKNASDYLSLLMGKDLGIVYLVDSISKNANFPIQINEKIPATRSDFLAMEKAIEASELRIRSEKMNFLPKLNAFGNFQLNDSHIFGFGARDYFAGFQVSWDIFKGNRTKNSIATQKIENKKLAEQLSQQKAQSQLELNKAYRDLSDAQFDIRQQNTAIEQAAEALQILQNRFDKGLVNVTDVLQASTQLLQQKFALTQAEFNASVTIAYIQFLTTSSLKK